MSKYKQLSDSERNKINTLYGKIKYNQFGECMRIKHKKRYPKKKKIFGKTKSLYHYTVAYAYKYKKLLNYEEYPNLCISHVCGNAYSKARKGGKLKTMNKRGDEKSLCMNYNHLVIESTKENDDRRNCHSFIRKFYSHFYSDTSVSVKGKLTVDVIKRRLQSKGITDYDTNINCSHRNRRKCFIYYTKKKDVDE